MTQALFAVGQLVATPAAVELMKLNAVDPLTLLARHVSGDWGVLGQDDIDLQMWALEDEKLDPDAAERILSSYALGTDASSPLIRVSIITEADRSYTTFLLPDEY